MAGSTTRGLNATARYVRLFSRARTTAFGTSLYEVEVYGDENPACGARSCSNPAPSNTTSLVIASPSIGARVSTATLRSAARIAQNPASKKVYVWADGGLHQLDLSMLLSTPVVNGTVISAALPGGRFFTSVQGMAFGPEGNLYLVATSFGAGVSSTAANDLLPDPGRHLLGLRLIPVAGGFEVESRQLVTGFSQPIDSLLLGSKLYVIEYGTAGRIFELSLPVSG